MQALTKNYKLYIQGAATICDRLVTVYTGVCQSDVSGVCQSGQKMRPLGTLLTILIQSVVDFEII